ncbi:MAG: hypothetical protein IKZ91_02970 [Bacteroidales bacterium]|nr:hypothetical protein [Bacteroidales bacterium]
MKHKLLIVTVFAAAAAVSCQMVPSCPDAPGPELGTVTVTAGFEDTRTAIDGNTGDVEWSAHEQMLMFPSRYGYQVREGRVFTSTNDSPQKTAQFTGVLPTADFEFTDYWAIYPVHAEAFCNGDDIQGSLPASQTGVPDTFPDNLCVAAAFTTDPYHLSFQHPLSGLRFSVQSEGIRKVTFRSNSNYWINGVYQLSCDSKGVVTTSGYSQSGSEKDYVEQAVTELVPQSGTFEPGRSYYIVLLPLPMSGGFTLLFERSDGKFAYKSVDSTVDFPRATFRTLMDADAGLEWVGSEPHLSTQTVNLGESAAYFTVDVRCPAGDYTVESDCDWLREVAAEGDVISYSDAYNLKLGGIAQFQGCTHGFLSKANTGAARTGHIIFKQGGKDYPVTVNQEAGSLPLITRHHLGFTMRQIDRQNDWYKRDLLWNASKECPAGTLNIAEGFSGSNGSTTFLTGKWLTWLYRNWGAIDGRVTLVGTASANTVDDIKSMMNESDEYYPPRTSIAVTASSVDAETRIISANVEVYAAKAGTYKLTGVLIEESASYGNGGMYTKNSSNLVVAMLTEYSGQSFTIDSDGGTASFELSVTAPEEVHSSATGNWGDLDQMQILLYTQVAYGTQAKVNVTAPLNSSTHYIDNSRIVLPGETCGFEVQ